MILKQFYAGAQFPAIGVAGPDFDTHAAEDSVWLNYINVSNYYFTIESDQSSKGSSVLGYISKYTQGAIKLTPRPMYVLVITDGIGVAPAANFPPSRLWLGIDPRDALPAGILQFG